jgi:hypothetical protein
MSKVGKAKEKTGHLSQSRKNGMMPLKSLRPFPFDSAQGKKSLKSFKSFKSEGPPAFAEGFGEARVGGPRETAGAASGFRLRSNYGGTRCRAKQDRRKKGMMEEWQKTIRADGME